MIRDPKSVVFSFSALQRDHSLEDDEERKISAVRESREPRIAKWRRTLCLGSITSVIVLIINLTMVLWASLRKSEHGQSVLALSNNCDRIKQLSTGVHLLINILSTLLLAASNFAMVCSVDIPSIGQFGDELTCVAMCGCTDQDGCESFACTRRMARHWGSQYAESIADIQDASVTLALPCPIVCAASFTVSFTLAGWQSNADEAVTTPRCTRHFRRTSHSYTSRTRPSHP